MPRTHNGYRLCSSERSTPNGALYILTNSIVPFIDGSDTINDTWLTRGYGTLSSFGRRT